MIKQVPIQTCTLVYSAMSMSLARASTRPCEVDTYASLLWSREGARENLLVCCKSVRKKVLARG